MTDLIEIKKETAVEAFTGDKLDAILDQIRAAALSATPDIETATGRKEIASRAYAVRKSKTLIDSAGKDITAEWKAKSRLVDISRKKARDTLDALASEVRKPLDDWEAQQQAIEDAKAAEAARVEQERLDAERREREAREAALAERERKLAEAEAAHRRAEDQRRQEKELAERQAREAAEAKVRAEREAEDRRRREAEAAAKAERDMKEALERAEREKAEAIESARAEERAAQRRKEEAAQREADAEAARHRAAEKDRANRARVHDEIKAFLIEKGLDEKSALSVVELLAGGFVPRVSVNYTTVQREAA